MKSGREAAKQRGKNGAAVEMRGGNERERDGGEGKGELSQRAFSDNFQVVHCPIMLNINVSSDLDL